MSTATCMKTTRAWRRLSVGARRGAAAGLGFALIGGTVLGASGGLPATAVAAPVARAAVVAKQPAAAAVAYAGTTPEAPVVKSTVSVGGQVGGSAPAPPVDAMGSPAASTLVQADDLQLTGITHLAPLPQTVGSAWENVGYNHQGTLSPAVPQAGPDLVNPNYPTAAGRFLDPNSDRVLAFRMTGYPQQNPSLSLGGDMFQLGSTDDGTEVAHSPCPLAAGDTCSFFLPGNGNDRSFVTDGDSSQGVGIYAGALDQPATTQQWSLVDAGDGYVHLLNRSDGLCLAAEYQSVGSIAVTVPCDIGDFITPEWKLVTEAPGTTSLLNSDGLELGAVGVGAGDAQMVAPGSPSGNLDTEQITEPGGVIPTWSTGVTGYGLAFQAVPFALATGDLDRVVGADDAYHDEAVVAYADGVTHQLQVRVIDYTANASHLLVTAPDVALPTIGAQRDNGWFFGSVGAAVGDFAGDDALNQIAVTWQDATGRFHLTMLRYAATADGGRALTVIGDPAGTTLFTDQAATESLTSGYAQTVAGDFEGGGNGNHAEVAIAYAAANPGTTQLSGHLGVVSLTSDFHVRGETSIQFTVYAELTNSAEDGGTWTPHGLRVAAGYFKDDPADGYDFRRQELTVSWTEDPGANLGVAIYDVDDRADCTAATCALSLAAQAGPTFYALNPPLNLPISVAAGGFEGVGTGADPPLWDIVFYIHKGLLIVQPQAGANGFLDPHSQDLAFGGNLTEVVLTAYDREGASLELGAPLIYTITSLTRDTLIAAQPPAHADWLDGKWVNVSRVGDFAVKIGSTTTKVFSHTETNSASYTDGGSESLDIKGSLRDGTKDDNVTVSAGVKQKLAKVWTETSSNFTKYSTTITSTATATGQDDDIVQALIQTEYFYRYPILGQPPYQDPDGSLVYPFYQVTIPGQVVPVNGFGRDLSWYQPSWQNGDALSYQKLVDGQVAIPDLGSYSYTDNTGQTVNVTAPLLDTVNSVGGGATTDQLEITGTTGTGNTTTSGSKLDASVQVTLGVSAKGDVGIFAGSGSVST